MKLTSTSFSNGDTIPEKYAFGVFDAESHFTFGPNISPHLAWSDPPAGTRSFALICHDPDVPSVGKDVNREGRTVPHDLPRVDFYHWVLVDIPAELREIPEGAGSSGITPRGKPLGQTPYGRTGKNDFTGWFAGDEEMGGEYGGYDGPAPPWNDERLHHYHFTIFALDVDQLDLPESFEGEDARRAMEGHILGSAEWVGTYTLNPELRG